LLYAFPFGNPYVLGISFLYPSYILNNTRTVIPDVILPFNEFSTFIKLFILAFKIINLFILEKSLRIDVN